MIDREAIKSQQQVLKTLGYYDGAIDGIWSRKSIESKVAFERSGKFNPGIPNSGMPFNMSVKLPSGLTSDSEGYLAIIGQAVETKVVAEVTTPLPNAIVTPPPIVPNALPPVIPAVETTTPPPIVPNPNSNSSHKHNKS